MDGLGQKPFARNDGYAVMSHIFQRSLRQLAQQAGTVVRQLKMALLSSSDPVSGAVKAQYQPENTESGWMPYLTPLAGAGWGIVAIPPNGTQVAIAHEGGFAEAGVVLGCVWDNNNRPPANYNPGEIWLVNQAGNFAKLTNDGKVTLTDKAGTKIILNGDNTATITASGGLTITANTTITGTLAVSGAVTGQSTATFSGEGRFNGGHTVSQHTHTQGPDSDGDIEQPTNKPTG